MILEIAISYKLHADSSKMVPTHASIASKAILSLKTTAYIQRISKYMILFAIASLTRFVSNAHMDIISIY
jgi:hypothetical protein